MYLGGFYISHPSYPNPAYMADGLMCSFLTYKRPSRLWLLDVYRCNRPVLDGIRVRFPEKPAFYRAFKKKSLEPIDPVFGILG